MLSLEVLSTKRVGVYACVWESTCDIMRFTRHKLPKRGGEHLEFSICSCQCLYSLCLIRMGPCFFGWFILGEANFNFKYAWQLVSTRYWEPKQIGSGLKGRTEMYPDLHWALFWSWSTIHAVPGQLKPVWQGSTTSLTGKVTSTMKKKWCVLNSRRAGCTVFCCLAVMAFSVFLQWGIFTPHGEVLLLHIMDQSAGSSLCGTLLLVMWQFPARDFHSYLAFGFLHDAVINASMPHVVIVLAEEDVFVLSHSPLVWCFSLLLPYLWLVGMHLYLASVLLTFKESSKVHGCFISTGNASFRELAPWWRPDPEHSLVWRWEICFFIF